MRRALPAAQLISQGTSLQECPRIKKLNIGRERFSIGTGGFPQENSSICSGRFALYNFLVPGIRIT
jgi:hypothetical protein